MSTDGSIPVQHGWNLSYALPSDERNAPAFPDRCINCGAPKEAESVMSLSRNVMRKQRQVRVESKFRVPHCLRCARLTKSMFMAGCIPFALGFLVIGVAVFILVAFGVSGSGLDHYGRSDRSPSLILGAFIGLVAGFAGGLILEWLVRFVVLPQPGTGLRRWPLLAVQLIGDSDYVAGLRGRLNRDGTRLELSFENEELAREFEVLNPGAVRCG
jgi:hypothetical protein